MNESLKLNGPGVALCAAVSALATLVEKIEVFFVGQSYLEALVIAILLGVLVRAFWAPGPYSFKDSITKPFSSLPVSQSVTS